MYDSSLPPVPSPIENQKQSKIGIASFVIGVLALIILCIGFLIAIGYGVSIGLENPYPTDPYSLVDSSETMILIASGFIYCSPVLSLVGLGLGIAAVLQKKDKKTWGIAGLVINALILLSVCGLFLIGLLIMPVSTSLG